MAAHPRLHPGHGPRAAPGGPLGRGLELSLADPPGQARAAEARPGLLLVGAAEIATLAGGLRRGPSQSELGLLSDNGAGTDPAGRGGGDGVLALAAYEGRILAVGRRAQVEAQVAELGIPAEQLDVLDVAGRLVTPGLVDAHTHLLFAGTRHAELQLRQRGHGYLEILSAGGGILQTVRQTRAASDDELLDNARRWLAEMLSHGVTTVEVKSGYGLDTASELRLLGLIGRLAAESELDIVPTFLGAHAVSPEYRERPDAAPAYLQSVIEEQLPAVAEQGVATSCDVFCEQGVFGAEDAGRLLRAAHELGLAARLHADELQPSGGAQLAAEIGALSADHLAAISDEGIEALGQAADQGRPVVATLLPATTLYLLEDHYAPARRLIERGVPVALGTDFNPGTSPTPNLQLVLSLACLKLGLSPAEALTALTVNAAAALGMANEAGSLEVGKPADMVVWEVSSHELLPYWLGANLVRAVIKHGRLAYRRA